MEGFLYQVSPEIEKNLNKADLLNSSVYRASEFYKNLLDLQFDSLSLRICYAFVFSNIPMSKGEVSAVLKNRLASFGRKKENVLEEEILAIFDFYQSIFWDYYATGKPVKTSFLLSAYTKLSGKSKHLKGWSRKIKKYLSIQKKNEHPLVTAALVYIMIYYDGDLSRPNVLLSHLAFWAIICTFGYNANNLIVLERFWKEDFEEYRFALETAQKRENATIWIEYFVKSYVEECGRVLAGISENPDGSGVQTIKQSDIQNGLTERQSAILSTFSNKSKQVTNRKVQREFKISQLTASRELSHLASKGFIRPHGRGRNTYYTRI